MTLDKAEYRVKLEEINSLAEAGKFQEAAMVADQVEWKHVKSARTLCMIGEIYEANRRYEDSARILRYAYKRSSSSKTVLYRLAELDIRNGDYDEARRFINEFEQNSPNDTSRYILKYKLLRAERAPLDDQIEVLREYKDHEYTERWAYELARLYKKNGQKDKCIEECDDLILWFTEGKYVTKAMELKMSLTSLTPAQQLAYDTRYREEEKKAAEAAEEETVKLTGIENVEKTILASDDDDEDAKPSVTAGEAITRMDIAAETAVGKEAEEEPLKEETAGEKKSSVRAAAGGLQKKLTNSIRAVFSGIRHSDDEDEDEDMKIAPDRSEREVLPEDTEDVQVEQMAEFTAAGEDAEGAADFTMPEDEVASADTAEFKPVDEEAALAGDTAEYKNMTEGSDPVSENAAEEPENMTEGSDPVSENEAEEAENMTEGSDPVSENTPEEAEKTEEADQPEGSGESIPDADESDLLDLDKLFAETGNALADEVASGSYVFADTLESDREEAEEAAEQARRFAAGEPVGTEEEQRNPADDLIARETDESLGLTRELHLRDAIQEELARRSKESSGMPIMRPEEAARKAVAEAQGVPFVPSEDSSPYVSPLADLPEDEGISDEELMKLYAGDDALRAELMAGDGDLPEVPAEESREALLNLSSADGAESEESRSIIDSIMGESGVFMLIPVEGRELTEPEKKAMSYFASIPGVDYQVTSALADIHNNCGDKTSKSGNVVIMGRQGSGKTRLAEGLILMTCMHLNIKAAKVAHIVAEEFNKKDPAQVVQRMAGGFLIIEAAGALKDEVIDKLNQAMEFRTDDLIVILEDEKADMKQLLDKHPAFAEKFTSRITVPVFTNDELVTFARTYAKEEGYKFDEMATLALYTMIGDNQRDTEPMTVGKVRELVDKAIERNSRKLFGKTTDKEDGRIVLMEKDFNF